MKIVMFVFILTAFVLSACGGVTPITHIPTNTSIPLPTAYVTGSPTIEMAYEKLSPSKIRIPSIELTVELSGRLTPSILDIEISISVPVGFLTVFPANTEPALIKEEELSTLSFPLKLEYYRSGGGSGPENGLYKARGTTSYYVKTPLTIGQKINITELVTFSEYVNVKGAIPLTIELIVEPASISTSEG